MTLKLRPYQHTAVEHLRANPRAGLFLEMGLGKTASVLSALRPQDLPALVIAPKRVATHVWPEERDLWRNDLTLAAATGSPQHRLDAVRSQADITVIGRDVLRDLRRFRELPYRTVILDELSGFKDRKSLRWRLANWITRQERVRNVWGLTGTPAPNGLIDLWAQLALLDQGQRLGKTLTGYRRAYFAPGAYWGQAVTRWDLLDGADEQIRSKISDICLYMDSASHITLPAVTHNTVTVTLPAAARRAYDQLREGLLAQLQGGTAITAANAAVMTGKLAQVTAGFLYGDADDPAPTASSTHRLHREKLDALAEIREGITSPVLVFYAYRAELQAILAEHPDAVTIDSPDAIGRWNKGHIPMLLAHPASAGHGLNLQYGGHTIVWTSLPWSLELWEQGNARLARSGQTHPVVIHTIAAERTVDQIITRRLAGKSYTQRMLLDHLAAPARRAS